MCMQACACAAKRRLCPCSVCVCVCCMSTTSHMFDTCRHLPKILLTPAGTCQKFCRHLPTPAIAGVSFRYAPIPPSCTVEWQHLPISPHVRQHICCSIQRVLLGGTPHQICQKCPKKGAQLGLDWQQGNALLGGFCHQTPACVSLHGPALGSRWDPSAQQQIRVSNRPCVNVLCARCPVFLRICMGIC